MLTLIQPIAFTDSMSCGAVYQALTTHSWELSRSLKEDDMTGYAHHGWPIVGETWGGGITDIHDGKSTLSYDEVKEAIDDAETRSVVAEGGHGGGAAMMCQGHKGGTGTSSRLVPGVDGEEYVVDVLVQSNYGQRAMLHIGGVPIGKLLLRDEVEQKSSAEDPARGHEGSGCFSVSIRMKSTLTRHRHHCRGNHQCATAASSAPAPGHSRYLWNSPQWVVTVLHTTPPATS